LIYNFALRIPIAEAPTSFDASSPDSLGLAPSKIVAIGVNYRAHAVEMGKTAPSEPLMFLKAPSALLPHKGNIVRPEGYERVDFEAELAVVIGKAGRRIAAADALDHVAGLACANDVTVRDLQKRDGQWTRAKGFDTFFPLGPRLVRGLDPSDLRIRARVNGETRQDSRTSDMIFSVPEIIECVSAVMTLEEGDIITTGTPSGVGNLCVGDVVEIEIEGIGILENTVVGE
jgi:2-keto-4-pentenoate hydratase/2-oxohepta-3-ene-1,7-dioic acid hydratase in catechol pathway